MQSKTKPAACLIERITRQSNRKISEFFTNFYLKCSDKKMKNPQVFFYRNKDDRILNIFKAVCCS